MHLIEENIAKQLEWCGEAPFQQDLAAKAALAAGMEAKGRECAEVEAQLHARN